MLILRPVGSLCVSSNLCDCACHVLGCVPVKVALRQYAALLLREVADAPVCSLRTLSCLWCLAVRQSTLAAKSAKLTTTLLNFHILSPFNLDPQLQYTSKLFAWFKSLCDNLSTAVIPSFLAETNQA